MVTKKNVLVASALLTLVWILVGIGEDQLCGGAQYGDCTRSLDNLVINFLPLFPIFILSLIVYFLRDEIFYMWIKFVFVWIPITMLAIYIAPEYGNALLPIEKGTVGGFFSLVFILISLAVIAWKYFATKAK